MKMVISLALLLCLVLSQGCSPKAETNHVTKNGTDAALAVPTSESASIITDQIVEASCGQCQFGMEGSGCDLAVRIDGKTYYVDGSSIDDHGDAHGDDGLCNCVRQARVYGEIDDGRFAATNFVLLPREN